MLEQVEQPRNRPGLGNELGGLQPGQDFAGEPPTEDEQRQRDQEVGDAQADECQRREQVVGARIFMGGGIDAKWNPQPPRDEKDADGDEQSRAETVYDNVTDGGAELK